LAKDGLTCGLGGGGGSTAGAGGGATLGRKNGLPATPPSRAKEHEIKNIEWRMKTSTATLIFQNYIQSARSKAAYQDWLK